MLVTVIVPSKASVTVPPPWRAVSKAPSVGVVTIPPACVITGPKHNCTQMANNNVVEKRAESGQRGSRVIIGWLGQVQKSLHDRVVGRAIDGDAQRTNRWII